MAKDKDKEKEVAETEVTMTLAQMVNAWEPINMFFQKFAELGPLLKSVASLDQQAGESLRRRDQAIEIGDAAEKVTTEKLAMFQQKIDRASQESTRILQKAQEDADTARENATREAEEFMRHAKNDLDKTRKLESASKDRLKNLDAEIELAEKALAGLNKTIEAAQAKIAEFTK